MVILGFCLLCPSFCPHKLRHFISEKTGPFLACQGGRKGGEEEEEEGRKKGGGRRRSRERE